MSKKLSMHIPADVDHVDVYEAVAGQFGTSLQGIGTVLEYNGMTTFLELDDHDDIVVHVGSKASVTRQALFAALKPHCAFPRPSQFAYAEGGGQEDAGQDLSF